MGTTQKRQVLFMPNSGLTSENKTEVSAAAVHGETSYIAFISYRHLPLDKKAAEIVQKKIENYTIPKEFRKKFGGKRFGHVFRDEDELPATGSLTDNIYEALDRSEFLIVICTPDLPKSKWCEAEIRYFLKTHDRNKVLAVLADGDPEESFSPLLLYRFDSDGNPADEYEPLAANCAGVDHTLDKKALNRELVRFYAAFLGCPFDHLWQRDRRAHMNRLLSFAGIAVVIMAVFLGVVIDKNRHIEDQNAQIRDQNEQLEKSNREIKEQNDKIKDQNTEIENQNQELQSRLSHQLVDSGFSKLEDNDIQGALQDGIEAFGSGDSAIYDRRAGLLFSNALNAYAYYELTCSMVYSQPTEIVSAALSSDQKHLLILDEAGALKCLDPKDHTLLWEISTGDKKTSVFTKNLKDRILYQNRSGAFCHDISDGSLIWERRRRDLIGNGFSALSDNGELFAVFEQDSSSQTDSLVFLDTKDGHELGRADMTDEKKSASMTFLNSYSYFAAFSPDCSSFACSIPVRFYNEEGIASYFDCFWSIDLETFEKTKLGETNGRIDLYYGADIDPADGSVFVAFFSADSKSISSVLFTKTEEGYDYDEVHINHEISRLGGNSYDDTAYGASDCRFLCAKGRAFIFSDNDILIFDRHENIRMQHYSLSARIVNAVWADPENRVLEVFTEDGYFTDLYMDYSDGRVLLNDFSGVTYCGQKPLTKACPSDRSLLNSDGFCYIISEDAPCWLFSVSYKTDPNMEKVRTGTFGSYLVTPGLDTGILFDETRGYAAWFDKKTGGIRRICKYKRKNSYSSGIYAVDAVQTDEEHFISQDRIFSIDGTSERYAAPLKNDYSECIPEQHIKLSNGSILSWNDFILSDYERADEKKPESGDYARMQALWLDGSPVERFCDPQRTILFASNSAENYPLTAVGECGMVMEYVMALETDGNSFTEPEEKKLYFLDALTEEITVMENHYPESEIFKAVLAHSKHLCLAAYEDGKVCIYDPDAKTAAPLKCGYSQSEIALVCFSEDDSLICILTASGRLDIYDTQSRDLKFSGSTDLFEKISKENDLYKNYYLHAVTGCGTGACWIGVGTIGHQISSKYCVIMDTSAWIPVSEIEGYSLQYDPDTDELFRIGSSYAVSEDAKKGTSSGSCLIHQPVYDIPALKAWAEEELSDKP